MTIKPLLKFFIKPLVWGYYYLLKAYYTWLLEKLVKRANRLSKEENRRYIVTRMGGRPRIYAKQELKEALRMRRFKKGVTLEDVEKHAYYITNPGITKAPAPKRVGIKK